MTTPPPSADRAERGVLRFVVPIFVFGFPLLLVLLLWATDGAWWVLPLVAVLFVGAILLVVRAFRRRRDTAVAAGSAFRGAGRDAALARGWRWQDRAPLPPDDVLAASFAELNTPAYAKIRASGFTEVVAGESSGVPFTAGHLAGNQFVLTPDPSPGADASANVLFVPLPAALPVFRLVDRAHALKDDYGTRMRSAGSAGDRAVDARWRLETPDGQPVPGPAGAALPALAELAGAPLGPLTIASTGTHLVLSGDPAGDVEAIAARAAFAARAVALLAGGAGGPGM